MPQDAAFTGNLIFKEFALVFATGEVYVFAGDLPVSWVDDQTLLAPFYATFPDRGGVHLLRLDGTGSIVDGPPPTPAGPSPPPTSSADGLWRLTTGGSAAYVEELGSGRRVPVPTTQTYLWSPQGHLLAIGGGRCGKVPVSFVDPDAATPVRQADLGGAIARSYTWRPDASGIALATIEPSKIVFVRADDLAIRLLAPILPATMEGEPIPRPWSPSGAHLLFGVYFGRPCPY